MSGRQGVARRIFVVSLLGIVLAACGAAPPRPLPSPSPSATPPLCSNASVLATWGIPRLTAQVIAVPVEETSLGSIAPEVDQGAGGILLFGSAAPPDLGAQLQAVEAAAPGAIRPLVMTDEEGGGVQRMANLVGAMPWARAMAQTMSPSQIEALAHSVGQAMAAQGVTMDLAPVLDVDGGDGPNASDPDGWRSFSTDPEVASADGLAFAQGLEAAGVIPVVKHFPGLGGASGNTDNGPAATVPYSSLEASGLLAFEAAINQGLPAVMVANASVPGLTTSPASLSSAAITGLLVDKLHFHGLVLTDSLSAGAIADIGLDVPQATVEAIAAGADMVMFSSGNANALLSATESAMVTAVAGGQVKLSRLVQAADEVLLAKDIDLCPGAGGPTQPGPRGQLGLGNRPG